MKIEETKVESTNGRKGYEPSVITIYVKNKGIVLKESSMVLINQDTNFIMALGNEAEQAMDTAAPPVVAVNPLRRGIIANYTLAIKIFGYYIRKARYAGSLWENLKGAILPKPKIVVCVPEPLTEVEEKAFTETFYQSGARQVLMTEMSLEQAIDSFSDRYSVIVGITWSGCEKR